MTLVQQLKGDKLVILDGIHADEISYFSHSMLNESVEILYATKHHSKKIDQRSSASFAQSLLRVCGLLVKTRSYGFSSHDLCEELRRSAPNFNTVLLHKAANNLERIWIRSHCSHYQDVRTNESDEFSREAPLSVLKLGSLAYSSLFQSSTSIGSDELSEGKAVTSLDEPTDLDKLSMNENTPFLSSEDNDHSNDRKDE